MSTDLNPRESYGQLFFLDNTIESLEGTIDIQIGLTTATADLVLNRNVLLARGKTLSLEDHSAPYNRVALSMVNGVLVVGTGGLGMRVGDIEIYQDTIESTAGNVDFKIGNTTATANLVIGRNMVMSAGKTITTPRIVINDGGIRTVSGGTTLTIDFATDSIILWTAPSGTAVITLSNYTAGASVKLIIALTTSRDITFGISSAAHSSTGLDNWNGAGGGNIDIANTAVHLNYTCITALAAGCYVAVTAN